MSWLPFPALRFLPLGLHLRYREPHQPVQHQRNTSATCRTHLHPPEGAPVCGGWDQHQRSKYPPLPPPLPPLTGTPGLAKEHVPRSHTDTQATKFLLFWVFFFLFLILCPTPGSELRSSELEIYFKFWAAALGPSLCCLNGFYGVSATPVNKSGAHRFLQQMRKWVCVYSLAFARSQQNLAGKACSVG